MSSTDRELVFLTDCASNIEASLLRGALESSGIFCHVQGENHRALLGAIASQHIALRILVGRSDAEAAAAIVSEYRRAAGGQPKPYVEDELDRRLARARWKGLFPSFGMAHHHMRAHGLGVVFGGLQGYGVFALATGRVGAGLAAIIGAILGDVLLVGAVAIAERRRV